MAKNSGAWITGLSLNLKILTNFFFLLYIVSAFILCILNKEVACWSYNYFFFLFYLCFCQTVHEGRIYQLKLFCDKDYPEKPPSVRFHSRINMTCVNHETGVVSVIIFDMLYAVVGYIKLQTVLTQWLCFFNWW